MFKKNGETWVFRNGLHKDGRFPLRSLLRASSPSISHPQNGMRAYFASRYAEVNQAALCYFAVSIFWRAAAHTWDRKFTHPRKLGAYEAAFREYLLQQQSVFPEDTALWIFIREESVADFVLHAPTTRRADGYHLHWFNMPGYGFYLFVGKGLRHIHRQLCFATAFGSRLIMSPFHEEQVEDATRRLIPGALIEI